MNLNEYLATILQWPGLTKEEAAEAQAKIKRLYQGRNLKNRKVYFTYPFEENRPNLSRLFIFAQTKEGHSYWYHLYEAECEFYRLKELSG